MHKNKVIIISGRSGEGKTTLLKQVIDILQERGIIISGFYAKGKWEKDSRINHCLININGKERIELCTTSKTKGWIKENRFYFNPEAIKAGNQILKKVVESKPDLIIIDEIGPFELQGKIWASEFKNILKNYKSPILITAKQKLVKSIVSTFNITNFIELPSSVKPEKIVKLIESDNNLVG